MCLCTVISVASKALSSGYLRDLEQVYDHYLELLSAGTKELKGTVFSADVCPGPSPLSYVACLAHVFFFFLPVCRIAEAG